ncbi:MAG TPA: amino acid ABC transporter permease [Micromonosporaceae bacterium]
MDVLIERFHLFFDGFLLTLQVCVVAGVLALAFGIVAAVCRISPIPPLRWLGTAYVTVFRNVPLTVVLFFTVFGLPIIGNRAEFLKIHGLDRLFPRLTIDLPYFRLVCLGLAIYTGAFVCEALRSGVNAVASGQSEAARALGLTFIQNLRYVVLPQAWKAAIVPLGTVLVAMAKNSALAGFFGLVGDLSATMQTLVSQEGEPLIPVMIGISFWYLLMTIPASLVLDTVERRRKLA